MGMEGRGESGRCGCDSGWSRHLCPALIAHPHGERCTRRSGTTRQKDTELVSNQVTRNSFHDLG